MGIGVRVIIVYNLTFVWCVLLFCLIDESTWR